LPSGSSDTAVAEDLGFESVWFSSTAAILQERSQLMTVARPARITAIHTVVCGVRERHPDGEHLHRRAK
jgi:hypothetical protein